MRARSVELSENERDVDLHHGRRGRPVPIGAPGPPGHTPRALLPAVAPRILRPRRGLRDHAAGTRLLRAPLRASLPVWKVRPGLRPQILLSPAAQHPFPPPP